jgi:hypothetical protein
MDSGSTTVTSIQHFNIARYVIEPVGKITWGPAMQIVSECVHCLVVPISSHPLIISFSHPRISTSLR